MGKWFKERLLPGAVVAALTVGVPTIVLTIGASLSDWAWYLKGGFTLGILAISLAGTAGAFGLYDRWQFIRTQVTPENAEEYLLKWLATANIPVRRMSDASELTSLQLLPGSGEYLYVVRRATDPLRALVQAPMDVTDNSKEAISKLSPRDQEDFRADLKIALLGHKVSYYGLSHPLTGFTIEKGVRLSLHAEQPFVQAIEMVREAFGTAALMIQKAARLMDG